jgi:hypothetical protein
MLGLFAGATSRVHNGFPLAVGVGTQREVTRAAALVRELEPTAPVGSTVGSSA